PAGRTTPKCSPCSPTTPPSDGSRSASARRSRYCCSYACSRSRSSRSRVSKSISPAKRVVINDGCPERKAKARVGGDHAGGSPVVTISRLLDPHDLVQDPGRALLRHSPATGVDVGELRDDPRRRRPGDLP